MIAPHLKSLGGQTRNVSYFASLLCQQCQKTVTFLQSALAVNASVFSEEVPKNRNTSFGQNSLPKCRHFSTQIVRHVSKRNDADQNRSTENKMLPSSESEVSQFEENDDDIKGKTCKKLDEELLLETLTENQETVKCVQVVPGKGPPPNPPLDCCMSGCANCVWIKYAEDMRDYYCADGLEKALKDIEQIEDANLKAYLKLELSFINK